MLSSVFQTKKAGTMQTLYYEVRGPAGTIFVMEVETESAKKARDSLNTLIKKTM
jgi:tRNA A58 N-methylase Trm61